MSKYWKFILLAGILLLAAYLRLYRISDYMTFLGDEGRDVLVAKGILDGHLTLLGPRASAGDFYLGPIYYYMIAPFLWLFHFDPVGPAVMVALFGIATVGLVYYAGKKFFNEKAGLASAALYAVSPIVINYSHSSWNPNVLPFFSLLIILIIHKALEMGRHSWRYFLTAGMLLGVALQLHYLALFLGVIIFFYILVGKWYLNKKLLIVSTLKNYLQIFVGFILGFSPFLAFEARHGFPNIRTIAGFIASDTLHKKYDTHGNFLTTVGDVFYRIFARLVFHSQYLEKYLIDKTSMLIFGIVIMFVAILAIFTVKYAKNKLVAILIYLWLFLGVLMFGLYKKPIYDYYFAFLFPVPFLIIGNLISKISELKFNKVVAALLGIVLFLVVFAYNLSDMPFRYEPNRQKNQIKTISEFVVSKTDNKPFNFALIAGGNSDHGYRYYFDVLGHKPVMIENLLKDSERKSVTDQLMIVCEEKVCNPLGYPLFEVANFGRAEIVGEWNVSVVKVYRMVHYKGK